MSHAEHQNITYSGKATSRGRPVVKIDLSDLDLTPKYPWVPYVPPPMPPMTAGALDYKRLKSEGIGL